MAVKDRQIEEMLAPMVKALGFELWGVEYQSQGRYSVVRIYIDSENGVNVDDCAAVSRQASAIMDVEDPISGEYTLEVSSPGMDRRLFRLAQYATYIGEVIEIQLRTPFEGRRKFRGVLTGVEGEDIVVHVDNHEYLLPFDMVDKARVELRA